MVTIFIGNLNSNTNASRIHREFEAFGKLTKVFVPMEQGEEQENEQGKEKGKKQGKEQGKKQNKGYAFVTFLDRASAEEAISKMNRTKLDGRVVRVNESKPRG
jgi:RNA recognition motif-containing protein